MDWPALLAVGALLVAIFAALSRVLEKSLSVREHEEFRAGIARELAQIRIDYHRDDERMERRLDVLEQTRPTTGELEAKIRAERAKE
jgi:uncharacterized protein YqgV (UPF0045/DUF77 family)